MKNQTTSQAGERTQKHYQSSRLLRASDAAALGCTVNESEKKYTKHAYGWLCAIELVVKGSRSRARAVAEELGTDKSSAYFNALCEAEKAVPYAFADAADESLLDALLAQRESERAQRGVDEQNRLLAAIDEMLAASGEAFAALRKRRTSCGGYWYDSRVMDGQNRAESDDQFKARLSAVRAEVESGKRYVTVSGGVPTWWSK